MKASEYIKKLEFLLAEHGDLECMGFYGYEQSIRQMKPPTLEHRKFYEIGDPKTLATHEMWDDTDPVNVVPVERSDPRLSVW